MYFDAKALGVHSHVPLFFFSLSTRPPDDSSAMMRKTSLKKKKSSNQKLKKYNYKEKGIMNAKSIPYLSKKLSRGWRFLGYVILKTKYAMKRDLMAFIGLTGSDDIILLSTRTKHFGISNRSSPADRHFIISISILSIPITN